MLFQMNIEEFGEFIEVRSKRKKNVKGEENHLRLKLEGKGYFYDQISIFSFDYKNLWKEANNNKDEGISSASPTESDQGTLGKSGKFPEKLIFRFEIGTASRFKEANKKEKTKKE